MSIILNGDTGITTPGLTNTGTETIVNLTTTGNTTLGDATTDTLTVGVTGIVKDASGNVGIGTASPSSLLHVSSSAATNWQVRVSGTSASNFSAARFYNDVGSALDVGISGSTASYGSSLGMIGTATNNSLTFKTNDIERMRIDTSGNLLVGTTSTTLGSVGCQIFGSGYMQITRDANPALILKRGSNGGEIVTFYDEGGTKRGYINVTTSATTYNTISDYRLKENIAPMTGALATVAQLNPVTYTWKSTGEQSQGFIAHELQALVPDCVTGEKDAVETVEIKDEDGNVTGTEECPVYQGIDTSFLVATLTAAIQELKALVDTQASTITALTARITALENK